MEKPEARRRTPHPVTCFRNFISSVVEPRMPAGVSAVRPRAPEPNFFPGASGLPTEECWGELTPGSRGENGSLPIVGRRDLFVLANFQATVQSYKELVEDSESVFRVTWRSLRILLGDYPPYRTFLTNAHIGLVQSARVTAPVPKSPAYLAACRELLKMELLAFRPRVVVTLGAPAARLLTQTVDGLQGWRNWPGFDNLRNSGRQTVDKCLVGDHAFAVVAVPHPSAVLSRVLREVDARVIARSLSKE